MTRRDSMARYLHGDIRVSGCFACSDPFPVVMSLSAAVPIRPFWVECKNCEAAGPNTDSVTLAIAAWSALIDGQTIEAPEVLHLVPEVRHLIASAVREARKYCPHACVGKCPNTLGPGEDYKWADLALEAAKLKLP